MSTVGDTVPGDGDGDGAGQELVMLLCCWQEPLDCPSAMSISMNTSMFDYC
jgi:hypothetical protein